MSAPVLTCRTDSRRRALCDENERIGSIRWNGIDFAQMCATCPKTIEVALLCPAQKGRPYSFELRGGCPEQSHPVSGAGSGKNEPLAVTLKEPLGTGTYKITLLGDAVDPRHASAIFAVHGGVSSQRAAGGTGCGVSSSGDRNVTEIDPKPTAECPPKAGPAPALDYLSRDFSSLRQMLLDRLSVLQPEWKERRIADFGVACVELFAYVGDLLSYEQDAVATEAYLGTSRMRISVRRHAKLVDYSVHEGCNARMWVQVQVDSEVQIDRRDFFLIPRIEDDRLQDRASIAIDDLRDHSDSLLLAYEILPIPKSRKLKEADVKDWFGLAASVVDRSHVFSEMLESLLPAPLVSSLRTLASELNPVAFPGELKKALTRELREIVGQHSLSLLSGHREARQAGDKNLVQCNRAILHAEAPQLFGDPGDSNLVRFSPDLNAIRFYTWDQEECCLPVGATSATLLDSLPQSSADEYSPRTSRCSGQVARHHEERRLKHLSIGDVLIFEEVKGPQTGVGYDADPNHRQAVRLTSVDYVFDPLHGTPIVEIEWHADDALKFPLCISSRATSGDCSMVRDVSVARGNVVLVDHGYTRRGNRLDVAPNWTSTKAGCQSTGCSSSSGTVQGRRAKFEPVIEDLDLTFADPLSEDVSARGVLGRRSVSKSIPKMDILGVPTRPAAGLLSNADGWDRAILQPGDFDEPDLLDRVLQLSEADFRLVQRVVSADVARELDDLRVARSTKANALAPSKDLIRRIKEAFHWDVRSDLLNSGPTERHVTVEMDNERRAHVRFGDGELGRRPGAGQAFWATYRTGGGPRGNLGAESIGHLVSKSGIRNGAILSVRNPLPATGGQAPESIDHVKLHAPHAFQRPMRAIIADDYPKLVLRDFADEVQACRAVLEWTGISHRASVTIDPKDHVRDRAGLVERVQTKLAEYRRINHEVMVQLPVYIGLDIAMTICVRDGFLRAHVRRDLLAEFSNGVLVDGRPGFFHPDTLSFGSPIYLSQLVRRAREVSGVENVEVTRLQRTGQPDQGELDSGLMQFGPFEIPRLDNDIRRPACGVLCLDMRGRA